MPSDLEFTGERFVPGIAGEIAHEHWHRYAFARRHVAGKRVLDVACGEGYGSALLAGSAKAITGIDIDAGAIAHARTRYAAVPNVHFEEGSAASLPLPDASVDVVVSFETIEHLPRTDQPRMLAEIARVLTGDGVLILSAPNPVEYSTARNYRNPFHQHEPDRAELSALLDGASFPAQRWFRQRRFFGSALWNEAAGDSVEAWQGDEASVDAARPPAAMYFVVVAARTQAALPAAEAALSLFTDRAEVELTRIDAEVARLAGHVQHLEEIAAYRERIVVERDAQLVEVQAAHVAERDALRDERDALNDERDGLAAALASARQALAAQKAECGRLERAITAQERIIAYRQSARWWVSLPWLRVRLWWQRVRGA
jgi:SAM-dependent methyltransferase